MKTLPAIEGGTPALDQYLVFGEPNLGDEEINELLDTIRSKWIGTGKKTLQFEEEFRAYTGAAYAVSVNSCTAALHLALMVSGIGNRDEVITTPMTFAATVNAIVHAGAYPVFVDIDKTSLNIDPTQIERKITSRTRAILPVHFGGLPCDMESIRVLARRYNLTIIEDAAHAIGAVYQNTRIGGSGNPTCFSFYANKNMTTGEGGMLTIDNKEQADRARLLRLHGLTNDAWKRYGKDLVLSDVVESGFKYNMTDLQSSLGIHQLRKLEGFLDRREAIAKLYDDAFGAYPLVQLQQRQTPASGNRHGLHLYVLLLNIEALRISHLDIIRALRAENIGVGIHYKSLHLHPCYRSFHSNFENAEWASERILSVPLVPQLSDDNAARIIEGIIKVLDYYKR